MHVLCFLLSPFACVAYSTTYSTGIFYHDTLTTQSISSALYQYIRFQHPITVSKTHDFATPNHFHPNSYIQLYQVQPTKVARVTLRLRFVVTTWTATVGVV